MKCMKYILVLICIKFCSADFHEDLQRVINHFSCDPACTFSHPEISSKTIDDFPICSEICGILVLNSNTDLSSWQLKVLFEHVQTLYGGIVIENTRLTDLSFFTTDTTVFREFDFFCEMYGFYIRNNSLLTDISTLYQFYLWGDENYKECDFRVENNEKLDVQKFYEDNVGLHYLEMRSSGNLRDFGCRGDEITSSNLPLYQNCTFFFGGLKLHNLTDQFDISYLSNVRTVIGSIDIQNTSLKDLSFMKNIELVQINNVGLEERVAFNIQNNARMTRFALFNLDLEHFRPGSTIANIENLHPDFCFTIEEILKISYLKFVNLHARFCEETGDLSGSILCRFDKLSNLDDNCNKILGDVLIEGGDEEYVSKLGDVWNIFGSLTIRDTNLKNLDFFRYLSYIISLDEDQPLIEISGNRELETAYFPAIMTTVSRSPTPIIIENNHPKMFNSSKFYLLFPQVPVKSIYPTTKYKTPPN